MIVRNLDQARTVNWGNGESRRLLLKSDGMGYSVTDTVVRAGTSSALKYEQHLEACYCIAGHGAVETSDGERCDIRPGVMYALDKHDAHRLIADADSDLRLVCVFNPPLNGDERHRLNQDGFSSYQS